VLTREIGKKREGVVREEHIVRIPMSIQMQRISAHELSPSVLLAEVNGETSSIFINARAFAHL